MVHPQRISKVFRAASGPVTALDDVSFRVDDGEFVVIRGPSGSGKTTLLLAIGGMLRPTSGQVTVDGQDLYAMSDRQRARFRADNIGFVFQMFHLVPYLSVLDNVLLGAGAGRSRASRDQAQTLLKRFDMTARIHHKPAQLSAGERQRTAMARAMLNEPKVIVADEPTGNLDPAAAASVIEGLAEFHRSGGTVIVVTHGTSADVHAGRIIHLRDGRIEA